MKDHQVVSASFSGCSFYVRWQYSVVMTDQEFEQLVEDGIAAIPEQFRQLVNNAAIVIADEPTSAQRHAMRLKHGHTLLGLYEGVPQSERGNHYSGVLPDKITIFRRPIEAAANGDIAQIRDIVCDTVWHELAHHFGMNEREVRALEAKRRRKRPRS